MRLAILAMLLLLSSGCVSLHNTRELPGTGEFTTFYDNDAGYSVLIPFSSSYSTSWLSILSPSPLYVGSWSEWDPHLMVMPYTLNGRDFNSYAREIMVVAESEQVALGYNRTNSTFLGHPSYELSFKVRNSKEPYHGRMILFANRKYLYEIYYIWPDANTTYRNRFDGIVSSFRLAGEG
jgi:hypothetical protein